jgi:hypothetical protein
MSPLCQLNLFVFTAASPRAPRAAAAAHLARIIVSATGRMTAERWSTP